MHTEKERADALEDLSARAWERMCALKDEHAAELRKLKAQLHNAQRSEQDAWERLGVAQKEADRSVKTANILARHREQELEEKKRELRGSWAIVKEVQGEVRRLDQVVTSKEQEVIAILREQRRCQKEY